MRQNQNKDRSVEKKNSREVDRQIIFIKTDPREVPKTNKAYIPENCPQTRLISFLWINIQKIKVVSIKRVYPCTHELCMLEVCSCVALMALSDSYWLSMCVSSAHQTAAASGTLQISPYQARTNPATQCLVFLSIIFASVPKF